MQWRGPQAAPQQPLIAQLPAPSQPGAPVFAPPGRPENHGGAMPAPGDPRVGAGFGRGGPWRPPHQPRPPRYFRPYVGHGHDGAGMAGHAGGDGSFVGPHRGAFPGGAQPGGQLLRSDGRQDGRYRGGRGGGGPSRGPKAPRHGGGGGRGGGHGGGGEVSAREKPHLFYNKSMVQDPWKDLLAALPPAAAPPSHSTPQAAPNAGPPGYFSLSTSTAASSSKDVQPTLLHCLLGRVPVKEEHGSFTTLQHSHLRMTLTSSAEGYVLLWT
eukprot:SM000126S26311  [mRNA]  locus=s126:126577:127603:+ [translate_table: standard]